MKTGESINRKNKRKAKLLVVLVIINIASQIVEILEQPEYEELFMNSTFTIHVDAGRSEKGKTKELIPELVGWIKSCGYDCEVKPDSFVASSIADKISK